MIIRQIYFTAPGIAELVEKEIPVLKDDDILVKTEYTAISGGTERANLVGLPNTSQSYPIALGYSGASKVVEKGAAVRDFAVGDRVLVYHGYHADYCVVKTHMLTKIDYPHERIPSIEAAFVIIASMSLGGVRKARIEVGESAMVMGQGILGIFATQLCRISGAVPVIAADLKAGRRELALKLGADYAFAPADATFADTVREATGGKGANAIIEVTGSSYAMKQALDCAAWQGRIALLGCTRISDCEVDYYQKVHRPGVSLIGAHNFVRPKYESYPGHWTHHDDCKALLKLVDLGRLKIAPVISEVLSPESAPSVYRRLAEGLDFPVGAVFDWSKLSV